MRMRYLSLSLGVFVVFYLVCGCVNEERTEIVQKKSVSPLESGGVVTPLPTSQRLGLLPVDVENRDESGIGAIKDVSSEASASEKEGQKAGSGENKMDMGSSSFTAGGFGKLELEWVTPEGWCEDTSKPMRVVSFNGGEHSGWECYISVLMSQAGGIEANLKRWANQMGKQDMDTRALEQLVDITILGRQCKLLDITGTYEDMQGVRHENYRLLGAVCSLENQTLFVKMTGSEKEVALQRDNFIKLCNSLSLKN